MRRTAIATLLTLMTSVAVATDAVASEAPATDASAMDPTATTAPVVKAVVAPAGSPAVPNQPLGDDLEGVKQALLKLKRDLVILEEDLLFPASTQVAVFLSMDIGELFQLDSVTLKLNGREVAHHLYTDKQTDALYRGGIQKLYVGNAKQGSNELTAFFTGRGPGGRDYRRATSVAFEKSFEPTFIELAIADSTADYQPEFRSAVSD
ncbi:MAG: AraC family transcriptional regulator [Pseudomonadales bacterium]|nr:AraC family transcriptional regulator [Pseudomonadales bacterium]